MTACPKCNSWRTRVKDSRPSEDGYTRRRRFCIGCGHRFTTFETSIHPLVVSADVKMKTARVRAAIADLEEQIISLTAKEPCHGPPHKTPSPATPENTPRSPVHVLSEERLHELLAR